LKLEGRKKNRGLISVEIKEDEGRGERLPLRLRFHTGRQLEHKRISATKMLARDLKRGRKQAASERDSHIRSWLSLRVKTES